MKKRAPLFALLTLSACSYFRTPPELPQQTAQPVREIQISHVVSRGETLSAIARRYLGEGGRWSEIAAANPGVNPNKLQPGQELIIPDNTMLAAAESSVTSEPRFRLGAPQEAQPKHLTKNGLPVAKSTTRSSTKSTTKTKKASEAQTASLAKKSSSKKSLAAAKNNSVQTASAQPQKASRTSRAPLEQPLEDRDYALTGEVGDKPARVAAPVESSPPPSVTETARALESTRTEIASAEIDPAPQKIERVKTAPSKSASAKSSPSDSGSVVRIKPITGRETASTTARSNERSSNRNSDRDNVPSITTPQTTVIRRPTAVKPATQVARSSFYSCMADKCSYHRGQ